MIAAVSHVREKSGDCVPYCRGEMISNRCSRLPLPRDQLELSFLANPRCELIAVRSLSLGAPLIPGTTLGGARERVGAIRRVGGGAVGNAVLRCVGQTGGQRSKGHRDRETTSQNQSSCWE
jgi:hypothetical protein